MKHKQGPASPKPVPTTWQRDRVWRQWAAQQYSQGGSSDFFFVQMIFLFFWWIHNQATLKRQTSCSFSTWLSRFFGQIPYILGSPIQTIKMPQDFAKASQLGLWSGPSGGKASQLWGGAGLRPYSVFNNESSESLNSSTARFRSSSPFPHAPVSLSEWGEEPVQFIRIKSFPALQASVWPPPRVSTISAHQPHRGLMQQLNRSQRDHQICSTTAL